MPRESIFSLHDEALVRQQRGERIIDGTVGVLLDDAGRLAVLPTVATALDELPSVSWAPYAPVAGEADFLDAVRQKAYPPELRASVIAVATPGATGAVGLAIAMGLEPGEVLLTLSTARLAGSVRRLTCMRGNALRSTTKMRAAGPFDVILVGGLLDYLPERAARTLLRHAGEMLNPEGLLGATNIAAANPWRLMLQLLADWTLIERSHDEMSRLLHQPKLTVSLALDDSRLTWLGVASNPDASSGSAG